MAKDKKSRFGNFGAQNKSYAPTGMTLRKLEEKKTVSDVVPVVTETVASDEPFTEAVEGAEVIEALSSDLAEDTSIVTETSEPESEPEAAPEAELVDAAVVAVVADPEDAVAEDEDIEAADPVVVAPVVVAEATAVPEPTEEAPKSFFQKPALFPTRFNNTGKTVVTGLTEDNCIGQASLLGSVADKVLRTIKDHKIVRVYGSLRTRDQRAVIVSPEIWAQIETGKFRVIPQPVSWFTHVMAHSLSDARVFGAGTVYAVCTKTVKPAGVATAKVLSFDAPLAYVISGADFESLV